MTLLERLVSELTYKPDWTFKVVDADSVGPYDILRPIIRERLVITCYIPDSTCGLPRLTKHNIMAPIELERYGVDSAKEWLIQAIVCVEIHEACKFFKLGDERSFYPDHDGPDTYRIKSLKKDKAVNPR